MIYHNRTARLLALRISLPGYIVFERFAKIITFLYDVNDIFSRFLKLRLDSEAFD